MARKRSLFQRAISTFLRGVRIRRNPRRGARFRELMLGVLMVVLVVSPVLSQVPPNGVRLEEAEMFYRTGQFSQAIPLLEEAVTMFQRQGDEVSRRKSAIALTNLGNAQRAVGQPEKAVDHLERAIAVYHQLGDEAGVKRGQIYRARAMQDLGLFLQACSALTQPLGLDVGICQEQEGFNSSNFTRHFSPRPIELEGWRSLGEVFRVLGKLEESGGILEQLAEIFPHEGAVLLSLGNTMRAKGNLERDRAALPKYDYQPWRCGQRKPEESGLRVALPSYNNSLGRYREAARWGDQKIQTQAQLNQLRLLLEMAQTEPARLSEAQTLLQKIDVSLLPQSHQRVYSEINLAKSQACLFQLKNQAKESEEKTIRETLIPSMKKTIQEAQLLKSKRTESYALGNLGGLYKYLGSQLNDSNQLHEWRNTAQELTEKALYLAQPREAPEIAYQWQWQLGRILVEQGENQRAIGVYEEAIKTLDLVRANLLSINSDVQFSFRDNVEPLYRQLLSLLLPPSEISPAPGNLQKALYYSEALQLAELENFLRCNLRVNEEFQRRQAQNSDEPIQNLIQHIERVFKNNPTSAFIYPIILKEHLAVIVKLPGENNFLYHTTGISSITVNEKVKQIRTQIIPKADFYEPEDRKYLQEVYQWIIQPFQDRLMVNNIQTLVFVLDGVFREIPMAALHDGQQFLVKQYAVTLVPSIQLLRLDRSKLAQDNAFIAGISDKREDLNFNNSIPLVKEEIEFLKTILKQPKTLQEQEFTTKAFQNELRSFSYDLVHLATHSRFSSDPQETIILTASQNPLRLNEFVSLLAARNLERTNPLKLLVLSACETAAGDRRALLGLAGMAVRSGTSSTIASLWKVDDRATQAFVKQFYQNLFPKDQRQVGVGEALRAAQIALLEQPDFEAPRHWAAFILVGSWL